MRVYKIKNALSSERNKLLKNTRFISPVFLVKNVYVTQNRTKSYKSVHNFHKKLLPFRQ